MKNRFFLVLVIFLSSTFLALPLMANDKAQKNCPVMGYPVNKNIHADHNGKRVYFCCPPCKEKFEKEPDKILMQMKEKGVEPEKTPGKK